MENIKNALSRLKVSSIMNDSIDIIYAKPLDCYVEIRYYTKLGSIRFIRDGEGLPDKKTLKASFELEQYFKGERTEFSCDFDISGLPAFTQKVLYETCRIKYGTTITYSELAERIGSRAVRAVGRALANNPIPIIIPCHRVVAKNGAGGYSGGLDIKTRLLELERNTANRNLITFNRSEMNLEPGPDGVADIL